MSGKPISEMTFEEAMVALEAVVSQLERGDVELEKSIRLYQDGAELRAHCESKLKEAQEKVELIRAQEGRAVGASPVEGL